MKFQYLRYSDGLWPNVAALAYVAGGYAVGIAALTADSLWGNAAGVVLTAHALVIAAYLIHECAHNTLFADNRHNAGLGEALGWLVGAGYGRYEDIQHKHFRHHVERADVVAFDFRRPLARRPRLLRLIRALEWCYVPAVDLMMHALVLILPFRRHDRRRLRKRVLAVAATRLVFFAALAAVSLKALAGYALAYLLFLHVMRFMDVHQHTYEVWETLDTEPVGAAARFDRDFEQRNTFSNPISLRHPWLNLLLLNFGYHNAHHMKPTAPWHALPRLHRKLYGADAGGVLSFRELLRSYHRHRVARVTNGDPPDSGRDFVGVVGVSFLTAH